MNAAAKFAERILTLATTEPADLIRPGDRILDGSRVVTVETVGWSDQLGRVLLVGEDDEGNPFERFYPATARVRLALSEAEIAYMAGRLREVSEALPPTYRQMPEPKRRAAERRAFQHRQQLQLF